MVIQIIEITDIRDPLILPWLDLYEGAFPVAERSLVSSHLESLIQPNPQSATRKHLLAALDAQGHFLGLARYTYISELPLIYLIYLAVIPEVRSLGIGTQLFEAVRHRSYTSYPQVKLIAWEVERPETTSIAEEQRASERRIEFYRRLGARMLYGVDHTIRNRPDLPQVPMHVMIASIPEASLDNIPQLEILRMLATHFGFAYNAAKFKVA